MKKNKEMNRNTTSILWLGGALFVGLGLGYVLFSSPEVQEHEGHTHDSMESTWTCSMHPQIRQNEPGACPICGMDLIPVGENSSSDPLTLTMTPEAVKLAHIQTTLVGADNSSSNSLNTLSLSGKIQADERLVANQVSHIPGRIEKLYISFVGESVNKGQKVAQLYSPELVTAQKELIEAVKLKASYPGLLDAARKKLAFWKIPKDQIERIEQDGKIQEHFDIRADASGVVTERNVAVGDHLHQGESLFELVSLSRVWVLFDAYEEDLSQIQVGNQIQFTTPGIPAKTFQSKITFIDPTINPKTRVATLRGELANPQGLLKPEMFVRGTLESHTQPTGQIRVPKSAVLWTGERSVVYVKIPDASIPSFQFVEVQLGERIGDSYLIAEGLKGGEEVVTQGSFAIDAAAQLNNQRSMMNRRVNISGNSELPNLTQSTPEAFQQQLTALSLAYISLKDALVLTDQGQASQKAQAFLDQLAAVDRKRLSAQDAHRYWMKQQPALLQHAEQIAHSADIEGQREAFGFLSTTLIETVQVMGSQDTLYIQHCPMAFEYEGADWLSLEKEIRNPYFGDLMMSCGSVTGEVHSVDPDS